MVRGIARSARGVGLIAIGVPSALRGRFETCVRGVLSIALAVGGLEAWMHRDDGMQLASYGTDADCVIE